MAGEYTLSLVMQAENKASSVIQGFLRDLGPVGGTVAIVGAALLGTGAIATKMAGDFQSSMTQLVTGAGESQANLGLVSQGILNMAVQTGTSTDQLSKGMFMIESAGYHGAAGLDVLRSSAMGAKVGNADLGTVADATTTIMKDFASTGITSAGAVNELIATVANGKTHMQDLATSLSQILPTASAGSIGLNDVMGAMATMTAEGVPAANAATYLRQTIIGLEAPSSGAKKALAAVGLTTTQVANEMHKSLPDALKMITDAVGKKFPAGSAAYVNAIKNISGGSKTMQGMLDLTGQHMKDFQSSVGLVSGAVKSGGKSIVGWSAVQQDFNFKMAQASEILETGMIRLGLILLPIVTNLVSGFISFSSTLAGWISYLQGGSAGATAIKIVLVLLAGAVLGFVASAIPALVAGFIAWATAAGAAAIATLVAAAPFILVGVIIAAVVIVIVLAIQHWGAITKWLQGVWGAVLGWLRGAWGAFSGWFMGALKAVAAFFTGIWNGIVSFLKGVWAWIVGAAKVAFMALIVIIGGPIALVALLIYSHWNQIKSFLAAAWAWVVSTARSMWNNVVNLFGSVWGNIASRLSSLMGNMRSWFANLASNALQWGRDLIQNLINGITSMIGNVAGAVGTIAHTIASFIHFSKPEKGPLASVEEWMPDFGDMLSQGLMAQAPKLQLAMTHAVQPLATGVPSSASGIGTGTGGSGGGGGSVVYNIYVQSTAASRREFAREIIDELSHMQRMSGQQPATASGRRY